jgi:hypothetical protein
VDKLKWNIKICSNNSKGERKWKQKKWKIGKSKSKWKNSRSKSKHANNPINANHESQTLWEPTKNIFNCTLSTQATSNPML